MAKEETEANDLVSFLNGKWMSINFEISDGAPVNRTEYPETMVTKDRHTITITAHGIKDGKDLTKDMTLFLEDNKITLRQGKFVAQGFRENNLYSLRGKLGDREYRFRLYTLGDKYVFHREIWAQGKILQVDMSYLDRVEL